MKKLSLTSKEKTLIADIIKMIASNPDGNYGSLEEATKGSQWYWEFATKSNICGEDLDLESAWDNIYSIPGIIGSLTQKGLVTVYKDPKAKTLTSYKVEEGLGYANESTLNWDFTNLESYSSELYEIFQETVRLNSER
jgi:hypothetical protein